MVHRLMLEAFVGPCPPGMECRHLNGVADDNRLENLCWGTHLENEMDRRRHGTMANKNRKLSEASVAELRAGERYLGYARDQARRLGVSKSLMSKVLNGKCRN